MSHGIIPAGRWRLARRCAQASVLLAVVFAPLFGGWQRLDRNYLSAWDGHGWDLPAWLLQLLPVGEPAARAYTANVMIGGGTGVSYASIPMVDPVAGAIAMSTLRISGRPPTDTVRLVAAYIA